ncbi:MAG: MerR family transcriptional regulator [Solirubrobacteraceae bacterium]
MSDGRESGLMTVGQLAQRTGLSHKAIRELEGRGLIYSAGRSESNYRLFDNTALWCAGAVGELRSLGLTLAEIEQLHASYLEDPAGPLDAQFAQLLDRSEQRIRAQIAAQQQTLKRIKAARQQNLEAPAGATDTDPSTVDPAIRTNGRRRATGP